MWSPISKQRSSEITKSSARSFVGLAITVCTRYCASSRKMITNDGNGSRKAQRDERPIKHRPQHRAGPAEPHLQPRPQSHWPAIFFSVARRGIGRSRALCADALPPGLAGYRTSLLRLHQARAVPGHADDAWHVDDLLCADDGAAGRLRKLFSALADRRERDGLPASEHALFLFPAARFPVFALRFFCEGWRAYFRLASLPATQRCTQRRPRTRFRHGPLDRQHRLVLLCFS